MPISLFKLFGYGGVAAGAVIKDRLCEMKNDRDDLCKLNGRLYFSDVAIDTDLEEHFRECLTGLSPEYSIIRDLLRKEAYDHCPFYTTYEEENEHLKYLDDRRRGSDRQKYTDEYFDALSVYSEKVVEILLSKQGKIPRKYLDKYRVNTSLRTYPTKYPYEEEKRIQRVKEFNSYIKWWDATLQENGFKDRMLVTSDEFMKHGFYYVDEIDLFETFKFRPYHYTWAPLHGTIYVYQEAEL